MTRRHAGLRPPRAAASRPELTLFEAEDGWRYSLRATNRAATTRGWLGHAAYIDAAHRVQARVEDAIRTGKQAGLGHFPSFDFKVNAAWLTASMIASILLAWLKLVALDGDLAKAEPKTLRPGCCTPPPVWSAADGGAALKSRRPGRGPMRSQPRGGALTRSRKPPDQHETIPASKEGDPGPVEPRPPGPPAGPPS